MFYEWVPVFLAIVHEVDMHVCMQGGDMIHVPANGFSPFHRFTCGSKLSRNTLVCQQRQWWRLQGGKHGDFKLLREISLANASWGNAVVVSVTHHKKDIMEVNSQKRVNHSHITGWQDWVCVEVRGKKHTIIFLIFYFSYNNIIWVMATASCCIMMNTNIFVCLQ